MKNKDIYKAYVCPRCGGTFHHKNHLFKCKATATIEKPQPTPETKPQPITEMQQPAEVVIQKPQPSQITVIQAEEVSKEDVVAPIGQPTEQATEQPTEQETEQETEEQVCQACGQSLKKIPSTWDRATLELLASLPYDIAGMIVHPCFEMTEKEAKVTAKCLKLMCDKRFPITKESKEDIIAVVGAFGAITMKKIAMYRKIKDIETAAAKARKAAEQQGTE
jgi:hypothetical protein